MALFTLACALAADLLGFVAARAVQGIGGALMTPVGPQIVLRHAPKSELVRAVALVTWPALLAPVIGPVLGGWIASHSALPASSCRCLPPAGGPPGPAATLFAIRVALL